MQIISTVHYSSGFCLMFRDVLPDHNGMEHLLGEIIDPFTCVISYRKCVNLLHVSIRTVLMHTSLLSWR